MSEQSLAIVGQQHLQQGGVGIDFNSKLFELRPATININQPNTQVEGAVHGNLRIAETGDQFKEMFVTLLAMPKEQRKYYVGEKGQLNRTQDNLMCFSRDMIAPDQKAKVPQAMRCEGCPKASWEPWRKKKEETGIKDPTLIPPCESEYYAVFIDTVYKMPLQMFIRSKSKTPFEKGMRELSRKFQMMASQGKNPNIFDIRFTISTEKVKNSNNTFSYILKLTDFKAIEPNERDAFGEVYLQYINRGKRTTAQQQAVEEADAMEDAAQAIEAEVVAPGSASTVIEGEYQSEITI